MIFADDATSWNYEVSSMPDSTFGIADTADATLENFFSRPIKIGSYNWAVGAMFFQDFDPWTAYFQNLRVINRICNYNLLRCKLKVKILINGNGFYYGRLIASYLPLRSLDQFSMNRAAFSQDLIGASQRPHIYIDPTTSQGGTLTLPFCWTANALSIPDQEWDKMGVMNIRSFSTLEHANGGTEAVTVSVFVWAEEVSLAIPTANEPGALAAQMGERDEYGTGPISRPAGTVARAAGALSRIPTLAPYARATQLAASTVSSVAQMFGMSRPAVLDDTLPVRPSLVGNMANTNIADSVVKLTLDAKQELTIDPRVTGLGDADEMTVQAIACRESYLTSFAWDVAAPAETLLFNTEVSPVLWDENGIINREFHLPACAFATLPFKYWRGSMKFRFQIIASAYHKGRCKVTFDPSYPLSNEYNTNYTHVIDISQEKDFSICVGWGATDSMLQYRNPFSNAIPYDTVPIGASPRPYGNGILSFYVVNELSTPSSSVDPIQVNVFVSMCDDFEVFEPTANVIKDATYFIGPMQPQMGEIVEANEPMDLAPCDTQAPSLDVADNTSLVYFGDPITSFRTCLKRYNFHVALPVHDSGTTFFRFLWADFPVHRGRNPHGMWLTSVPEAYNYTQMTLLNYLTPGFVTRRGGLRWKYVRMGGDSAANDFMHVLRGTLLNPVVYSEIGTRSPTGTENRNTRVRQANDFFSHTWSGVLATAVRNNPVLEVELPFYSPKRFVGAKRNLAAQSDDRHTIEGSWKCATSESGYLLAHVATGEDFNLSFFTGAPVLFYSPIFSEPAALP